MRIARTLGIGLAVTAVLAASASAWVRMAPADPADWHIDMAEPGFRPGANWAQFCPEPGSRFAPDPATMGGVLADLDAIAMETPRTARVAGRPEEGRITWVTRSAVMGFPDYATAQVLETEAGPRLCLLSRQRFGVEDMGVNAARIGGWAQRLLGLDEPPGPVPF